MYLPATEQHTVPLLRCSILRFTPGDHFTHGVDDIHQNGNSNSTQNKASVVMAAGFVVSAAAFCAKREVLKAVKPASDESKRRIFRFHISDFSGCMIRGQLLVLGICFSSSMVICSSSKPGREKDEKDEEHEQGEHRWMPIPNTSR